MTKTIRSFVLVTAAALLLSACGGLIGLPEPQTIPTAFGFGEGIDVDMTAVDTTGLAPAQTGATYSAQIDESFAIDATDLPAILTTIARIDGVTETLALETTLTLTNTNPSDFPQSFVVSNARIEDLTVLRNGNPLIQGLDFDGPADAEMTFTTDAACDAATSCTYTASNQVDLLEIGLTGGTANDYAKTIIDGGNFNVQATFSVDVDPALPSGTTIQAVVVGTGALLE